jgi:hypothetical protein
MRLAAQNTHRNLETCGVLAGYLVMNSQCFHFLMDSVNLALLSSVRIPSRCVSSLVCILMSFVMISEKWRF